MTRDVKIMMLALYDDSYRAVRQGAGRPSTDSTSATVSIFLGQDSKARELRVELGGHSFILRIDRLWSQCLLGERLCECIMDYIIFNQGVGACDKTTSASNL